MCNKKIRFFTTIIFSFIPVFLFAEQIETQISADTITVERDEVLFAEGNVLVRYGNNKIKAKALKFNQKTQEIKFTEIQDFFSNLEDYAKSYVSIFQSQYTKPVANPNAAHLAKVGKCNRLLTEINHKNGLSMTLLNDILICSHSKYTIDEFIPVLEKISPILTEIRTTLWPKIGSADLADLRD